jgi:hypothetical protein
MGKVFGASFSAIPLVTGTVHALWTKVIVTNTTPLVLHRDKKYRFALFYIK